MRQGKPPGPLSHVRSNAGRAYRMQQLEAAVAESLGDEYRARWSADGTILLTPQRSVPAAAPQEPDWNTEALRALWRMRSLALSSREGRFLVTDLPGDVSWDQVTALMDRMAQPPSRGHTISVRDQGEVRVAAVPLADRVVHFFDCRARDVTLPPLLQPDPGCIYLNVAIDATSRWVGGRTHNHCTLGFTSQCSRLATWWLASGSERWGNVFTIAQELDLDAELRSLADVRILKDGTSLSVLPFLCADGKAQVIMGGCAAFTKGGPFASVCWVCGLARPAIDAIFGTVSGLETPFAQRVAVSAVFRPIPPERRVPDYGLHGVCRMVFAGVNGLIAAAVAQGVARATAAKGVQAILDRSRLAARTATKNSLAGCAANEKGKVRVEAAAAVHFVKNGRYAVLLDWAREYGRLAGVNCGGGLWLTVCGDWWTAFARSGDFAWRSAHFSGAELRELRQVLETLGRAHRQLGFSVTLWTHLWVDHMYVYAVRWRVLGRFACWAMEGSHRRLKRMLRNSGGVSVLRERLRLQNVVDNGTIDDSLLRENWDVSARALTTQRGYRARKQYFRATVRSVRVSRLSVWEFLRRKRCLRAKKNDMR